MRLAPLFFLSLAAMLGLTNILAGQIVLTEWRSYSESAKGAEAVALLADALKSVEALSAERDPTTALFAAERPNDPERVAHLAAARAATDAAFGAILARLQADHFVDRAGSAPLIAGVRSTLGQLRRDVDAVGAQPRDHRDPAAPRDLIERMASLSNSLGPLVGEAELSAGTAEPAVFRITAIARLAADLHDYADQLGSLFAQPMAQNQPFSKAESFAVERLNGRITALAQQLDQAVAGAQIKSIDDAAAKMHHAYFGETIKLIEPLIAAGRSDGNYPINGAVFLDAYVPATATILAVRDAALDQALTVSAENRAQARRTMEFVSGIAALIVIVIADICLLLRSRVILPVIRFTKVIDGVNRRVRVDIPETTRRDEIGEMALALKNFQRNMLENDRLREEAEANRKNEAFLLRRQSEIERKSMNERQRLGQEAREAAEAHAASMQAQTEALTWERTLLRLLTDGIPDAIFLTDRNGVYQMVNKAFAAAVGQPVEAIIGRRAEDLFGRTMADLFEQLRRVVLHDSVARVFEWTMTWPDGSEIPAELITIPFAGEASETPGLIGIVRDVTPHKKAEEALLRAKELAEEAARLKSDFLANMSHEIRTPMNGVMAMAELLEQTTLNRDQRSMAEIIRSSGTSLLTIINDILDFSKIEAGKLDIESAPFSLIDTVEEAAELIATRADEKGIALTVDLDPAIPNRLEGDANRLRQILLNLMGNAVKFTDAGSVTLTVAPVEPAQAEGLRLRFTVADTGIGLSDAQRAALFRPFSQADITTARRFGGTGLGLSISQRLCMLMGGEIGVQSVEGEGSIFWFELSFAPLDAAAERPPVAIGDARILALGCDGPRRAALARLLAAAGIRQIFWQEADLPLDGADAALIFAASDAPIPEPSARTACSVMVASRGRTAEADASYWFATLSLPLRRRALWHVIAAALGRADLDLGDGRPTALPRWRKPPLGEALAAGAAILVAEDNRTNQLVITRLLDQLGYAHEVAENGREALTLWRKKSYGLLLTDCHMPEMDGFELTRRIRADEAAYMNGTVGPRQPIVALTADALAGTEQKCLDAGMDFYLSKPIERVALVRLLEKLLPVALALRKAETPEENPPQRAAPAPAIDPHILDTGRLSELFGPNEDEASHFLGEFLNAAPAMVEAVTAALVADDLSAAASAAHTLKGAARSIGAVRLGQLASDVQDCLDGGDVETARLLGEMLASTLMELSDGADLLFVRAPVIVR